MFLYGFIRAFFYIISPLVLITILSIFEVITFSQGFIINLIVIGIIGILLTLLKHMYPKESLKNRVIAFLIAIYQGIYLFYLFGGFTPRVRLGTYYIDTPLTQVILGLQLIAWLLLSISGISAIQHLIEIIELKKQKEYRIRIKYELKTKRFFKALSLLLNFIMIGYVASIIISGLNLKFHIHDLKPEDIGWNQGGTIIFPDDDTVNITVYFDVVNMGIYSIQDVLIDVDILTEETANPLTLPEYTKVGDINNVYFEKFPLLAISPDQAITVDIDPLYAPGLVVTDATLRLKITLETLYAGIFIDLNTSTLTQWNALL
jgi:hypothetical protein